MTAILNTASWKSETLTRALVARKDCDILADLIFLRNEVDLISLPSVTFGEKSERVDQYFENRRKSWTSGTHKPDPTSFINTFCSALQNMDREMRFVRTKRFLDLGCSPGGFATYVLRTNPEATGIGISIPVEVGGYDLYIPSSLLPRIDIHIADLMNYDLAPSIAKPTSSTQAAPPLPFETASLDLIICDARWVQHPDNLQRPWNWTRLLLSQLLIALHAVAPGGTLFLRLSHVDRTLTGRILLALCRIGNFVKSVKSSTFQAKLGYFYVLVQGVDRKSGEFGELVAALERLWYVMSFEGDEGYGRDITGEDEDSITTEEELMSEDGLLKLVRLGTPIWNIQHRALCGFLKKSGVL
ncbi:hypothetical protein FRC10_005502 [Ceratobasidium sp. 414]|nr:hypothetical protein FRC10_005502 [Ceratobasidium sp. 414]